jgi:dipeptidyl-peptidase-4
MKRNVFFLLLILTYSEAFSQLKKLTVEDAVVNARTTLAPKKLSQLGWIKNSENYFYIDTDAKPEALYTGNSSSKADEKIIDLDEMNRFLRVSKGDTLSKFPTITWKGSRQFIYRVNKNEYVFDLDKKQVYKNRTLDLKDNNDKQDEDTTTGRIAYTVDNNLYIYDGKNNIQITNDENKDIVNGSSVHRDEFGITKGTYWSPAGNKLAFYRMDQSMVADYPVIDFSMQPAKNKNIKYPMAGGNSHHVTVGIYDVAKGTKIFVATGEPKEQYLTNIAWSPDEKHIYIAVLNRDQNHMLLNSYNSETGVFEKTIYDESDDKYVEPLHPISFVKNNPAQFILQSRKDGYTHLYLFDATGKAIKQLTKGNWEVIEFLGYDHLGKHAYYIANAESPITKDLYSVSIPDGKIKRITSANGTHAPMVNYMNDEVIDVFSNTETPRITSVLNADGKEMKQLLVSSNPIKNYNWGNMKIFSIKNATNTELYCRMYYPPNMDSTHRYPVIVYVYGGPHVQLITNSWQGGQGDLWFHYLAQEGFVVFTLDSRGSANRGKAFEQATFRQLGTVEMEDQLTGVNYIKKLRYIDGNRIGVDGWSFGGFMTVSLMTRQPGIFKAGVAGGPVIDWSYYEVMYTERYMDTPQTNADGYNKSSLFNYIDNLKGKLLIIHGTSDDTVVWQHSINYIKKCVDKGVQLDYFVYPGHPHNVRGKDRVHLMTKITDYFRANL